jgi:hypothetical protein
MCHVCNKVYCASSTLSRHLKKVHQFKWPSGHNKFRYKLESDGYYRLQTLRYESLELVKELNEENGEQAIELAEENNTSVNDINLDLRDITLTDVSNQTNATSISTNTVINENNYVAIPSDANYGGGGGGGVDIHQTQAIAYYNEPTSSTSGEHYYAPPIESANNQHIIINNMHVVITNNNNNNNNTYLNYNPEEHHHHDSEQYANQSHLSTTVDLNSTLNRQFLNNFVQMEFNGGESSSAVDQHLNNNNNNNNNHNTSNNNTHLPSINAMNSELQNSGQGIFAASVKFEEFVVESFLNNQLRQQQQNANQHLQNHDCNTTMGVADNSSFMLI